MSNARIFFAGVATTILLIGAGFGGGLMMAKTAMEPAPQTRATAADRLPPARVVLPPSSEAATTPPPVTEGAVPTALPQQQAQPQFISATDLSARAEKGEAERAEKRKAEAAEREQRRRLAERKAKREAARLVKQRQDQQQKNASPQERAPVMAFGGDEQPKMGGFFGN
jgi:hypothetical protein